MLNYTSAVVTRSRSHAINAAANCQSQRAAIAGCQGQQAASTSCQDQQVTSAERSGLPDISESFSTVTAANAESHSNHSDAELPELVNTNSSSDSESEQAAPSCPVTLISESTAADLTSTVPAANAESHSNHSDAELPELVDTDSSSDSDSESEQAAPSCLVTLISESTAAASPSVLRIPLDAETVSIKAVVDFVGILYSNIRGLRRGAAQLIQRVGEQKPLFIVLTETHLDGDFLDAEMLPSFLDAEMCPRCSLVAKGQIKARRWRSHHGFGIADGQCSETG